uniref:Uncharacterized protein n=1 Tax=Panagrolaimus superbus TaxID=310955 RepID=A0A914YM75_9BILA
MKSLLAFVSAAVLATTAASAFAQSADMIPPEMAPRSVGKDGMVCGKVEKARYAEGSDEDELPGQPAAGSGLCHRRHHRHRPDHPAAGHRQRWPAGVPARHLAEQQGNRRCHRRHHRPGDVQAELRRRVQG